MKRYHLFAGDDCYEMGLRDYKSSYLSLQEAMEAGSNAAGMEWAEIMETQEDGSLKLVAHAEWYCSNTIEWLKH